jgi:hypothetical protein
MSIDKQKDPFNDDEAGFSDFDLDSDHFGDDDYDAQLSAADNADLDEPSATPVPAPAAPAKAKVSTNQQAPKSFIKSPLGIASIALAVAMVSLVGFKGYSYFTASSAQPEVAVENLVPAAQEPTFGGVTGLVKSQATVVAPTASAPVFEVPAAAPTSVNAPVMAVTAAVNPAVQAEMLTVQSTKVEEGIKELKDTIAEMKAMSQDIKGMMSDMNQSVMRLDASSKSMAADIAQIKAELAKRDVPVKVEPVTQAATSATAVLTGVAAPAVAGRQRIPDLQVIETSQNGEMSIVKKASNGRVFTLFKGETINWGGNKKQVTGIEKEGNIVHVGDNFYIDKVLESPKATVKAAESAAEARKAPTEVHKAPVEVRKAPAKEAKAAAPRSAAGYTLNAVYEGNNAFGIVNSKNEFKTYKIGEQVDNLGAVVGLNEDGDLKVGNTVIKSVYQ